MTRGTTNNSARRNGNNGLGIALVASATLIGVVAGPAFGSNINMSLRAVQSSVFIGDTIDFEVRLTSAGAASQSFLSADMLLSWDPSLDWPTFSRTMNVSGTAGALPATPASATQRILSIAPPGFSTITVAPAPGTLVATLHFKAMSASPAAFVRILSGDSTVILDPSMAEITGSVGNASVLVQTPEAATMSLMLVGAFAMLRRRRNP